MWRRACEPRSTTMADLRCEIAGVKSPNPFWLASAPPTDKEYNVVRAFKAGWGGVVWKTLGEDQPIVNVSSRYGAMSYNGKIGRAHVCTPVTNAQLVCSLLL